jgi:hypothetical protein
MRRATPLACFGRRRSIARCANALARLLSRGSQVRVVPGVPSENGSSHDGWADSKGGDAASICTSVCTPLDAATTKGAIDRLTRALLTAEDYAIPCLVAERAGMREELRELRGGPADIVMGRKGHGIARGGAR